MFNINFASDWIRTADLWQTRVGHNHCPSFFGVYTPAVYTVPLYVASFKLSNIFSVSSERARVPPKTAQFDPSVFWPVIVLLPV